MALAKSELALAPAHADQEIIEAGRCLEVPEDFSDQYGIGIWGKFLPRILKFISPDGRHWQAIERSDVGRQKQIHWVFEGKTNDGRRIEAVSDTIPDQNWMMMYWLVGGEETEIVREGDKLYVKSWQGDFSPGEKGLVDLEMVKEFLMGTVRVLVESREVRVEVDLKGRAGGWWTYESHPGKEEDGLLADSGREEDYWEDPRSRFRRLTGGVKTPRLRLKPPKEEPGKFKRLTAGV